MIAGFDLRKAMQADGLDCGSLRASLHEPSPGCKHCDSHNHPRGHIQQKHAQETTVGVEPKWRGPSGTAGLYFSKLYTRGRGDIL
jgi:hypothetical protein